MPVETLVETVSELRSAKRRTKTIKDLELEAPTERGVKCGLTARKQSTIQLGAVSSVVASDDAQ